MPPPKPGPAPSGFDKKQPGNQFGVDKKLRDRVEGKVLSAQEASDMLKRLEAQTAVMRNKYEQYFLGLERAAPNQEREALKKQIDEIKLQVGRNTALKFAAQSLYHRFQTYERMWARTEKDIEEGRYKRDLFKARLHSKEKEDEKAIERALARAEREEEAPPAEPPAAPKATLIPGSVAAKAGTTPPPIAKAGVTPPPVARPGTPPPVARPLGTPPPRPAGAPPPPARAAVPPPPAARAASAPGTPSDDKLRAVYQAYVSAKKQCKESTKGMTFEQVASQLRQQVPQILSQTKAKGVDFKVVIKDGKASLRAVPKD